MCDELGKDYALSVPCEEVSDSCSMDHSEHDECGQDCVKSVPCKDDSGCVDTDSDPQVSLSTYPRDIVKSWEESQLQC
jgi:hypothetical protein